MEREKGHTQTIHFTARKRIGEICSSWVRRGWEHASPEAGDGDMLGRTSCWCLCSRGDEGGTGGVLKGASGEI